MNAQEQVAENTRKRGYREGWTATQFAARQVAKLVEELGELLLTIWSSRGMYNVPYWERLIDTASQDARSHFDNDRRWNDVHISDPREELADIQVVLFNLADAYVELSGESFDVVQAAVAKSESDIERGKR